MQADEALATIEQLRSMYQQHAVASLGFAAPDTGGLGTTALTGQRGGLPDARSFDAQMQHLAASLKHMAGALPAGASVPGAQHQQGMEPVTLGPPSSESGHPGQGDGISGRVPPVSALTHLSAHFLASVQTNSSTSTSAVSGAVAGTGSSSGAGETEDTPADAASVDDLSRRFAEYLEAASSSPSVATAAADSFSEFSEAQLAAARNLMRSLGLACAVSHSRASEDGEAGETEAPASPLPVESMVAAFSSVLTELRQQGSSLPTGEQAPAAAAGGEAAVDGAQGPRHSSTPAGDISASFEACLQHLPASALPPLPEQLTAPRTLTASAFSPNLHTSSTYASTPVGLPTGMDASQPWPHPGSVPLADQDTDVSDAGDPQDDGSTGTGERVTAQRTSSPQLPALTSRSERTLSPATISTMAEVQREHLEHALQQVAEKHAGLLTQDSQAAELWRDVEAAMAGGRQPEAAAAMAAAVTSSSSSSNIAGNGMLPATLSMAGREAALAAAAVPVRAPVSSEIEVFEDQPFAVQQPLSTPVAGITPGGPGDGRSDCACHNDCAARGRKFDISWVPCSRRLRKKSARALRIVGNGSSLPDQFLEAFCVRCTSCLLLASRPTPSCLSCPVLPLPVLS